MLGWRANTLKKNEEEFLEYPKRKTRTGENLRFVRRIELEMFLEPNVKNHSGRKP